MTKHNFKQYMACRPALPLLAVLAVTLMFAGCKKENSHPGLSGKGILLSSENHAGDSKTYVDGLAVGWVQGDEVYVNGNIYSIDEVSVDGQYAAIDDIEGDQFLAFYPTSITKHPYYTGEEMSSSTANSTSTVVYLPREYTYVKTSRGQRLDLPMVGRNVQNASLDGYAKSIQFKHICATVEVVVTNPSHAIAGLHIDRITIESVNQYLAGCCTIDVSANNWNASTLPISGWRSDPNWSYYDVTMYTPGLLLAKGATERIQIPVAPTNHPLTITVHGRYSSGLVSPEVQFQRTTSSTSTLARAEVGRQTAVMDLTDANHVSSPLFSVSPTKKVFFANGNLQYQPSSQTWRLAGQQYTCLLNTDTGDPHNASNGGNAVSIENGRETMDKWIDLFGWGTSGYQSGQTSYQPWAIAQTNTYGPGDGDNGDYDLTGTYANCDWGVYNNITGEGSDYNGLWRVLTYEELNYLLFQRPNAANLRGPGKVDGMKGLIILHDNCTNFSSFTSFGTNSQASYNGNNAFTVKGWQDFQQSTGGAVFLPFCGRRESLTVSTDRGTYWTSSYAPDVTDPTHAKYGQKLSWQFMINGARSVNIWNNPRHQGAAVRLVVEVPSN